MNAERTIVVGGGIVGAAVFQRLSGEPCRALTLVERTRPALGATGFSGGILRAFHLDHSLAQDCLQGLAFYRAMAARHGDAFRLQRTGFLHMVDPPNLALARTTHATLCAELDLQWLEASEAARRFGAAIRPALVAAVYEPHAGYVDPTQVTRALLALGQQSGGELLSGVQLLGLQHEAGVLTGIHTNSGTLACDCLVLCTGAWTPALGRRLGVSTRVALRAKAIQVNAVRTHPGVNRLPAFVDMATQVYGRPDGPGGALIGAPVDEWDVDADQMGVPTQADQTQALQHATDCWPALAQAQACGGYRRFDAFEPSGRGWVGWARGVHGVMVASGFSGNGVKLAPSVAERVAGLLRQPQVAISHDMSEVA